MKKGRIQRPFFCGRRGIRTPGPVKVNGFQDRRIRPLCHPSLKRCKGGDFFWKQQALSHFFDYFAEKITQYL